MSIRLEDLAAAVDDAGGEAAAAAELGVHVTTVSRWVNGVQTPPRTREHALRMFIRSHQPSAAKRPLAGYTTQQLADELVRRAKESS